MREVYLFRAPMPARARRVEAMSSARASPNVAANNGCVELSGSLVLGFECAPLFLADSPGIFGGLFFLEELGGFFIGDTLCVKGAVAAGCGLGCPVPCLFANTATDCP